jgi:hypothetical protein
MKALSAALWRIHFEIKFDYSRVFLNFPNLESQGFTLLSEMKTIMICYGIKDSKKQNAFIFFALFSIIGISLKFGHMHKMKEVDFWNTCCAVRYISIFCCF